MSLYHPSAEQSAIGVMLVSEQALGEGLRTIQPDDFSNSTYREIFAALGRLRAQSKPSEALFQGEYPHLEEHAINAADFVVSAANYGYYLDTVRRVGAKRRAHQRITSLLAEFEDGLDNWETLAPKVKALSDSWSDGATRRLIPLREVELSEDDQRGILTGFGPMIDNLTGFGWPCGQTSVVSAIRKGGKSTFMLGSFRSCAGRGLRCVYATFADLAPKPLKRRLLKQECGLGGYPKVQLTRAADFEEAEAKIDDPYGPWNESYVYNGIDQGRDIEGFYGAMLSAHAQKPLDIVFCDYAQRITSKEIGPKFGRTATLEHVSEQLADLAGKLECPIVLGSQVTKKEGGEWMTKYASGVEEDVGLLLRITREDHEKTAKVECVLNRFGPQGVEIPLRWNDDYVRFEDMPAERRFN